MISTLAVHALLSRGAATLAGDTVIAVSRGARLEIEATAQADRIEVRAWDRDEVEVESAAPVRVSTTGALVRLVAPGGRSGRGRVSYEVSVPRWMPITVNASGADVTVQGAGADVAVETVGGSIRVNGGSGRVSTHSVGGSVNVENAQGRVDARSFNQGVRLIGINGEIRAESSNGSVRLERVELSKLARETLAIWFGASFIDISPVPPKPGLFARAAAWLTAT